MVFAGKAGKTSTTTYLPQSRLILACIDVSISCLISHPIKARFDRAIQEQRQGVLEGNTTIDYLSLGYITTCHSATVPQYLDSNCCVRTKMSYLNEGYLRYAFRIAADLQSSLSPWSEEPTVTSRFCFIPRR